MIRWTFVFLNIICIQCILTGQSQPKKDVVIPISNPIEKSLINIKDSSVDVSHIQISLLTLTPGDDLYSVFGHSAIRVKDTNIGTDIVYNYGTFDFSDPNFLPKFIRGELDYFVSQETYDDFISFYRSEGRGMNEQILQLTWKQKIDIQQYLFWNMEPNNRFYRYNFLYNNCTTKLRDIIEQFRDKNVQTDALVTTKGMSFRDGLHYYLDRSHQPWIKLGIDIILGSRIDKKMNNFESQFLPDFLEEGLDLTNKEGKPLVYKKTNILSSTLPPSKNTIFNPFLIFVFLLVIYIGLLFFSKNSNLKIIRSIDISLYLMSGLIGSILIFLWIYTLHEQSKENFNLLWAWPSHIIFIFFSSRKLKVVKWYWQLNSFILILTLITWLWNPQQLNLSLMPLMIIMAIAGLRNFKTQN